MMTGWKRAVLVAICLLLVLALVGSLLYPLIYLI